MKLKNFDELFEMEFEKDKDYYLAIRATKIGVKPPNRNIYIASIKEGDVFLQEEKRDVNWNTEDKPSTEDKKSLWHINQYRNGKLYANWWCEYDFIRKYHSDIFRLMTPNDKLGHKYGI